MKSEMQILHFYLVGRYAHTGCNLSDYIDLSDESKETTEKKLPLD